MSASGGGTGFGGIAGNFFNMAANRMETNAEASAYEANARWLREQAEFARLSTVRELTIHEREVEEFRGGQISGVARGGLDFSGSALVTLANTRMREFEEQRAIKEMGDLQVREASLKAEDAATKARNTRAMGKMKETAGYVNFFTSVGTSAFGGGK